MDGYQKRSSILAAWIYWLGREIQLYDWCLLLPVLVPFLEGGRREGNASRANSFKDDPREE